MKTAQSTIRIRWHDVLVEVSSNHSPLITHIREHVRPLIEANGGNRPQVSIRVNWQEADSGDAQFPLLALTEDRQANKIGKRLYRIQGKLLWTDIIRAKNMVTLLKLDGNQLQVTCDHFFDLPEKKLQRNPNYRYEKYFSLLKYFLYFPMIWYQEQFRGRYVMHASGVSLADRGIALGGVGGVGKTTTCIGLLTRQDTRLLSENLVFYDDNRLYQLYEPIRLDDQSVGLLGNREDTVYPANFPEGTRAKQLFHVHNRRLAQECKAAALILPEFSDTAGTIPLSPDTALLRQENYNLLTREVNDYYWYAATLNLLDGATEIPTYRRIEVLRQLLKKVPAYQLNIDRTRGVAPVVEDISAIAANAPAV